SRFAFGPRALGRQLADPRRPVAQRCTPAWPMARASTGTEQVIAAAAGKERTAPSGIGAGVRDVLTGDPDRVAVHGRRAVVAPASPRRIANLSLVACEPVFLCGSLAAIDDAPFADTDHGVDRRVGCAGV